MTVDDQQRLFRIVAGGWGIFYAIRSDGDVQWWYNTGWQTGSAQWANGGSPRTIGGGWHDFVEVLGSDNGTLWGVYGDGTVKRYRYICTNLSTGEGYWEGNASGTVVGTGWNQFRRVFGGPDGILWGVDDAGDLWRSDYVSGALTAPIKVGWGFGDCKWLGADKGGVIYAARRDELSWWRHTGGGWVNGGNPIKIGGGEWHDRAATYICAAGTGLFYSVKPVYDIALTASDLQWNLLNNYQTVHTSGVSWANGGTAKVVGGGFSVEPWAPLQGYASPTSVRSGATVGIRASTTFGTLSASVVRHDLATGPVEVQAPQTVPGALQTMPAGPVRNGCGWSSLLDVTVDAAWSSGVYSAKLVGPYGNTRHVPFVVRPAQPAAHLAVILPTLAYESYNTWGGHSAYNNVPSGVATLSNRRPSRTMHVEPTGRMDVELYSDLLLLRWLQGQGIAYDVYTDLDLHQDLCLLESYRAVMLGSHPEYVTGAMRQALALHVQRGGNLIYTGGNGLFESCDISADGSQTTWRGPGAARLLWRDRNLPESQITGVSYDARGWMTFAPYKVVATHPVLDGTGLSVGSTFGATGFNRGASGWEFDMAYLDGAATGSEVIAVGQNQAGNVGAHMVLMERPGRGKVFSASSMTFNGALGSDAAMSQLFRNVVDLFVADPA